MKHKIKLLFVFLVLTGLLIPRGSAELVNYWSLDEQGSVIDSVSGNNGNVTGAVSIDGKIENGLNFDGENDYVSTNLSTTFTNQITIALWIKPENMSNNVDDGVERLYTGQYGGFGTDRFVPWFHVDGTWRYGPNIESSIILNEWNYFVASYNGVTKEIKVYLNGEYKGSTILPDGLATYNITNFGNQFDMGTMQYHSGRQYKGGMDEVSIWNSVLEINEISSLYSAVSVPEISTLFLFIFGLLGTVFFKKI